MGYPFGKKGWKVYDLEIGNIFVSGDVIFHEEIYPFAQIQSVEKGGESNFGKNKNLYVEDYIDDCVRDNEFGKINMPNFTNFGNVNEIHQGSGTNGSVTPKRPSNEGSPMRNGPGPL